MHKKKILIIHHRSQYGGAPKSLIENLKFLQHSKNLEIDIICPYGDVYKRLSKMKFNLIKTYGVPLFDNSNFGYYKNVRWVIFLREFYFFLLFSITLFKIIKNYDLIHINEILCFPIIPILKKKFNAKIVVHQRTKLKKNNSMRVKWMNRILNKYVDKIISIDQACKASLNKKLIKKTVIIYNSLDITKIKKKKFKKKKKNKIVFGFVGQLTDSKGIKKLIFSFLDILKIYKNIELKIYSPIPQRKIINQILDFLKIRSDFYKFYIKEKLYDLKKIKFMGYKKNLNKVFSHIDVLVFPNEDHAIGRPVFEAGFYSTPSIAAYSEKKSEYIIHNKTGYTYYPNEKEKLKKQILNVIEKKRFKSMGKYAFKLSNKNFSLKANSKKLEDVYLNL